MTKTAFSPVTLSRGGFSITLDPTSALDLRSVVAGDVDWSPGLAIVDDGDPRIWHSLQGFLFSCGPDHIRHPEPLDTGTGHFPLHGSLPGHPVSALDVSADGASCRATIPLRLAMGAIAELERVWSISEEGVATLADRLTNTGDVPFPAMIMYHMNIGGRLLDGETRLSGAMLEDGGTRWDFHDDPGIVFCVSAAEAADETGMAQISLGPVRAAGGLTLRVRFPVSELPYLQLWRCRRDGVNVLGIEPVSHRWENRQELAARGELETLPPGGVKDYGLSFSFRKSA